MRITRALGALTKLMSFLMLFGGVAAAAAADSAEPWFDITKSRSSFLLLAEPGEAPKKVRPQDRRLRLRYDQPIQFGGSDLVLRLKAPLKKKKLLAFELIF